MDLDDNDPNDSLQNLTIESEHTAHMSEKDEAFLRSGNMALPFGGQKGEGIELEPFDTFRQIAAQKLGMELFNMGEEAVNEFLERGTYNGIFLDAILVVFLCASPKSKAIKATRMPSAIHTEAMNWANANMIVVGGTNHAALMAAYEQIVQDIITSVAEVDQTGLPEGKDSLGES